MAYIKSLVAVMVAVVLVGGVSPAGASDAFSDVGDTHPFHDEIAWLADTGITTGYNDGTFRSNSAVARQAIAAYLYRYNGQPAFTPPATPTFADVPTSHPFYKEIEWLASTGITTGYNDGTFRPTRPVSRQAIAAYLYRYDEAFGEPCGTQIQTQIPQTECDALVALYNDTNGPGWNTDTNWLTTNTPCGWYRVTCADELAATTNVVDLTLPFNGLTGTIPTQIGNLTNLTVLNLNGNSLTGTIPNQIGNLTNLTYLNLGQNGLTGTIPNQIGNLTNLNFFLLDGNGLSGPVPLEFLNLTSMLWLDLWDGSGNGCFTSSSGALTTFLDAKDADWDGGCA